MNENSKNSIELKVILIGAAGVGKTSFTNRYLHNDFKEHSSTIGASFLLKIWNSHKIAIWDTSGEEKYRGLSRYYCRGAGAVVMAFDLSNHNSFDQLEKEFVPLLEHTLESRVVAVVGMKSDLVGGGGELNGMGDDLAGSKGDGGDVEDGDMSLENVKETDSFRSRALQLLALLNKPNPFKPLYFETSSLHGTNVQEVFEALFIAAFQHPSPLPSASPFISLSSHHQPEKSNCSC